MLSYQPTKGEMPMELKILEMLYNYSINNKLVDEHFIDKLVEIVIEHKKLSWYVKEVNIVSGVNNVYCPFENSRVGAYYLPLEKSINVCCESLNQYMQMGDGNAYIFKGVELYFYKNLLTVQSLLHELEHANQLRMVDKNISGIEGEILQYSFDETIKVFRKFSIGFPIEQCFYGVNIDKIKKRYNQEEYELMPDERLAQHNSYEETIAILNYIKNFVPNVIKYQEFCKLQDSLRGYISMNEFIKAPTISFVKMLGEEESLNKFEWYDSNHTICLDKSKHMYSLYDRLKYGLPIDAYECESVYKSLVKMKEGLF